MADESAARSILRWWRGRSGRFWIITHVAFGVGLTTAALQIVSEACYEAGENRRAPTPIGTDLRGSLFGFLGIDRFRIAASTCKSIVENPPWLLLSGLVAGPSVLLTWFWRDQKRRDDTRQAHESGVAVRYAKAAELLANGDKMARTAGLFALWDIARESDGHRLTVARTLAAYVRERAHVTALATQQEGAEVVRRPPDSDVQNAAAILADPRWGEADWYIAGERVQVDLRSTDLSRAHLQGADLQRADLAHARLTDADLSGARLQQACLREADLRGAELAQAELREAKGARAKLNGANLVGATLDAAKLEDCDLTGAKLARAQLLGTVLERATLADAALEKATLIGAVLRNASLQGALLSGADLTDADLRDADLRAAVLRGATLRGAKLHDADLRQADLRGATLDGAQLQGANLDGASLDEATLVGAKLRGTSLHGAQLPDVDLTQADLQGANLAGAVLARARFGDTQATHADLSGAKYDASTSFPEGFVPGPARMMDVSSFGFPASRRSGA